MKHVSLLCLVLTCGLTALSAVQITVCDPTTLRPMWLHHQVMLGTQVSLLVHSDANDLWSGGLFIPDSFRSAGLLNWRTASEPNAVPGRASCRKAAGPAAFVLRWNDSWMSGFDLYTDERHPVPGDWFILDYTPLAEGPCQIDFYEHSVSFTVPDPNSTITLENTRSRDFNADGVINYLDFSILSSWWMTQNCTDPNGCGRVDLHPDGSIDLADVLMFADFWLWGSPNWPPDPATVPQPTVFYSLTDNNGLNELSIPIGQSIRLYINKTTQNTNVGVFHLEAMISDPLLGWIDNASYDPNAVPGPTSPELLATPRSTIFDKWGPGIVQPEGIVFLAANLDGPIQDGQIASFVYTAADVGDVTLNLFDHADNHIVELQPIVLHQYDPSAQLQSTSFQVDSLSTTSVAKTSLTVESTATSPTDPELLAEKLEQIWDKSPLLQQAIDEQKWLNFVDAVRESAATEALK